MKTINLVIDQKGIAQAYTSLQEAKIKFEHLAGTCRQNQAFNPTFNSRFVTCKVDEHQFVKQFYARYKNNKGLWINELYSLQTITIPEV